jgi:hypothetical protein
LNEIVVGQSLVPPTKVSKPRAVATGR